MKINKLVKPTLNKEIVYEIKDFASCTDFSPYTIVGDEIKSVKQNIALLRNAPTGSQSMYFVWNRLFSYAGGYIQEYKNYKFTKLDTCESMPILVPIKFEGTEEILVISDADCFILGKSETKYNIPVGSCWATYDNRLFMAKNNILHFGDKFDINTSSMNLNNFGNISVLSQDGNIVGLVPYENDLIVFCQNAIYVLNISTTNDFTFTKCNTCALKIKEKSVAKVGDAVFFISNKKLCSYKNGEVKYLNPMHEKYLETNTSTGNAYNEYYAIPFKINEEKYIYMFSTITQKAHIMSDAYGDFIGGKYLYDTDKRALYQIKESLSKTLEWTSLKMDFGTHKRKMITAIGITSNVNGFFYAFGETGNRWFYVKVGSNNKKMNLVGKQFYFSFAPSNNDMILKDFKINYIILED